LTLISWSFKPIFDNMFLNLKIGAKK
jgi:hypothetical protein